jgi:hypothetical protein
MPLLIEDIYRSSNGDRWLLVCDSEGGQAFVRHEANLSAGGQVTDMEIEDFLARGGSGPEHTALRQIIETHAVSDKE